MQKRGTEYFQPNNWEW